MKINLKYISVNIGLLFLLFLFVESFSFLYLRNNKSTESSENQFWNFEYHPGVGHSHIISDFQNSPNSTNADETSSFYTKNIYGDSPSQINMALLGGSTTDPLGSKYAGKGTWEYHLFNSLSKDSKSFIVYNAANAGANSSQELIRLITLSHNKKLDFVFSLNGYNEIYFAWNKGLREADNLLAPSMILSAIDKGIMKAKNKVFYEKFSTHIKEKFKQKLSNLNSYNLFSKIIKSNKSKSFTKTTCKSCDKLSKNSNESDLIAYGAEKWYKNVKLMRSISATFGSEYYVFLQPVFALDIDIQELRNIQQNEPKTGHNINKNIPNISLEVTENYLRQMNLLYKDLRIYCKDLDYCIDISNNIELNTNWKLWSDSRHFNSKGNYKMSKIMEKKVIAILNKNNK